jgi:uncharacterized protein (DUF736 family)
MPYDSGKGGLFKNTDKKSDQHPDYRGEANIDGQPHRISAWIRTAKSGTKYMSLAIQPKESDVERRKSATPSDDMEDSIPF